VRRYSKLDRAWRRNYSGRATADRLKAELPAAETVFSRRWRGSNQMRLSTLSNSFPARFLSSGKWRSPDSKYLFFLAVDNSPSNSQTLLKLVRCNDSFLGSLTVRSIFLDRRIQGIHQSQQDGPRTIVTNHDLA